MTPKQDRKHLLLITPGFAANEQDSRCIPPLQAYIRELHEKGPYRISVITLHYPFERKTYQWYGLTIYACGQSRFLKKLSCWWTARRYFDRIKAEQPIDGIHSFWLSDGALLGQRFARQLQIPHWLTFMGQDVRADNFYLKLIPPKNLYSITLSSFPDKALEQSIGYRANQIIPWGLDIHTPILDQERTIDILGVGNLIKLKNYALFIQLVARMREQRPGLRAVLIGDGVERQQLEAQAKAAGLEDVLSFKTYLPRSAVFDYMSRSKVFLHTSTFESFGYVFSEALACGMRVVSTKVGIAAEGEYWGVGETEEELARELAQALDKGATGESVVATTMTDTVKAYLEIYGEQV